MKVRDLVSPQKINPVIQLDKFDAAETLSTYVMTDEIAGLLLNGGFLSRLLEPQARNSFVFIGNYGSGKSHLLAYVDSLLNHPELWDFEKHPRLKEVEALRQKKFFTIKVKLSAVRLELDRIILEGMREALAAIGIPNPFVDWWGVVERCHKLFRNAPDFETFITAHGLLPNIWDLRFSDHDDSLFELADGFMRSQGVAIDLNVEAEKAIEQALKALAQHSDYGTDTTLVLIVDELSDFLQSKGGAEQLADLIFLRGLGEASFSWNFRMVAAVQHDILDPQLLGLAGSREQLNKILQRFEKRLFTSNYLHAVVRERVLVKTPAQHERAKKLYHNLRQKFPSMKLGEETFADLYPVHPDVIEIFQNLIQYLGNRSVLGFIADEITDEHFLESPYDTFLTPDKLFEGLKIEFEQRSELKPLAVTYTNVVDGGLSIMRERTRELTRRAFAALVAYQAAKKDVTVEDLVHATYFGLNVPDPAMNYDLLDAGLQELLGRTGALKVERGDQRKRVYKLVTDSGNDLVARMQQMKASIPKDDPRLPEVVKKLLAGELGLSGQDDLLTRGIKSHLVEWSSHKLLRVGTVHFINSPELITSVQDQEFQFFIAEAISRKPFGQLSLENLQALWLPTAPDDDDLDTLREAAAYATLEKDFNRSEPSIVGSLRLIKAQTDIKALNVVKNLYFDKGAVIRSSFPELGTSGYAEGTATARLDRLIGEAFSSMWEAHFHRAPRLGMSVPNTNYTNRLLKEFIAVAPVENPKQNLKNLLDPIAVPLVAREVGGTYLLNPDSVFVQEAEAQIKAADPKLGLPYQRLVEHFAETPFGLTVPLSQLIIATVVALGKGFLTVKGGGQVGLDDIARIDFGKVEFIKSTGLGKAPQRAAGILHTLGLGNPTFSTVATQNEVWKRAKTHMPGLLPESLEAQLQDLPINATSLITNLVGTRELLAPITGILDEYGSDARGGFDALVERCPDTGQLEKVIALKAELAELIDLGPSLREAKLYLMGVWEGVESERRLELLTSLNNGLLDAQGANNWLRDFRNFRDDYISAYIVRHDDVKGEGLPWQVLEKLSWPELKAASYLQRARPPTDIQALERERNEALAARCTKLSGHDLRQSPLCPHCHFRGEALVDPQVRAAELSDLGAQSLQRLGRAILEQRDIIGGNLRITAVSESTSTFLRTFLENGSLTGLNERIAKELDNLLDKDVRFISVSLEDFRTQMHEELSGKTFSWPEFSMALSRVMEGFRPDGVASKIRVQVQD